MQVKKFRQPTVREALTEIREELGADALVLSTEMVPARGWRGWLGTRDVQVTAAVPKAPMPGREPVPDRRPADILRLDPEASSRSGQALRLDPPGSSRSGQADPTYNSLLARLLATGLDRAMAETIVDGLPPAARRGASLPRLRAALASQLEELAAGGDAFAPVEVFIGPPGVGKTTTIAKIAAQERARRGRPINLVGADGFRAGAVEQLRTYASIIGAPFRIARTLEDLDQALAHNRQTALVDTAGRSPNDGSLRELRRLLASRKGVRTHLVLAADTSPTTARRILAAYQDAQPDRIVISKVDEAETLSPLWNVVKEHRLPISYVTTGQRVPEDLDRATPAALASIMLSDGHAGWATAAI